MKTETVSIVLLTYDITHNQRFAGFGSRITKVFKDADIARQYADKWSPVWRAGDERALEPEFGITPIKIGASNKKNFTLVVDTVEVIQ